MSFSYEGCLVNRSTSFPETVVLSRDNDFGGACDFQLINKAIVVGVAAITFRWTDRRGVAASHIDSGISLAATGVLVDGNFRFWTRNLTAQTLTVEVALTGLLGTPNFDFFFQAYGASFGQ